MLEASQRRLQHDLKSNATITFAGENVADKSLARLVGVPLTLVKLFKAARSTNLLVSL